MRVGVTDNMVTEYKYQYYIDWLQQDGVRVECTKLSYKLDNLAELDSCDALLLTGGQDVDPTLYHGPLNHPKIKNVDRLRDDFEQKAIDLSLHKEIPILGICRGMQIANVYFGGTILPDIEDAGYGPHRRADGNECRHAIFVDNRSMLKRSIRIAEGIVNSSHHQAVDEVGDGLKVAARSADGIVEAIELAEERDGQFFLLVQWHPERMMDVENPLTTNILNQFIIALKKNNR